MADFSLTDMLAAGGRGAAYAAPLAPMTEGLSVPVGAVIGVGSYLIDYFMSQGDDAETARKKAESIAAMTARTRNNFTATGADLGPNYDFNGTLGAAQQNAMLGAERAFGVGDQQQGLADALLARAEGRGGPSLAEMQLQQATDRTAKQAAGLIGSQRGLSPGTAARLAANAGANANQEAAGQAAMLRAQEQLQAQNALAQQLQAMRGGDIAQQQAAQGLYGTAGELRANQRAQALQNQLETQRLNAQVAAGNQQAAMQAEALAQGDEARAQQAEQNAQARTDRYIGGLASGASAAAAKMNSTPADPTAPIDFDLTSEMAHGGVVPGKPPPPGAPPVDTEVIAAEPGEIMLPRSITQHPNSPAMAAAFVDALRRRKAV